MPAGGCPSLGWPNILEGDALLKKWQAFQGYGVAASYVVTSLQGVWLELDFWGGVLKVNLLLNSKFSLKVNFKSRPGNFVPLRHVPQGQLCGPWVALTSY